MSPRLTKSKDVQDHVHKDDKPPDWAIIRPKRIRRVSPESPPKKLVKVSPEPSPKKIVKPSPVPSPK